MSKIEPLFGAPTYEQVATAVDAWLDENPDATTTVGNKSINYDKLTPGLQNAFEKTNLLSIDGLSGTASDSVTYAYNNGVFTISGTDTNTNLTIPLTSQAASKKFTLPAGTYTFSTTPNTTPTGPSSPIVRLVDYLDSSNVLASCSVYEADSDTFTLADETSYYMQFHKAVAGTINYNVSIQLEAGSEATTFVAPDITGAKDVVAREMAQDALDGLESIGTSQIQAGAVTTAKLADGSVTDAKLATNGIVNIKENLNLIYPTDDLPMSGSGTVINRVNDYTVSMYSTSTAGTTFFYPFNGDKIVKANNNTDVLTMRLPAGTYSYRYYVSKRNNVQLVYTTSTTAAYTKISDAYTGTFEGTYTGTFTVASDFIVGLRVYNGSNLGTSEDPTIVNFAIYEGKHTEYPYFDRFTAVDDIARYEAENTLPTYYFDNGYISDKISTLNSYYALSKNLVKFGWITDTHMLKNAGMSFKLMKYLGSHSESVPFVVFGGDVVGDITDETDITKQAIEWIDYMDDYGKDKVLQCRGNHDYLGAIPGEEDARLNLAARFNYVMGNQTMAGNDDNMYYFYDVPNRNTRIIIVDNYIGSATGGAPQFNQTEIDWILGTALNCSGKNIVFISHTSADSTLRGYTSNMDPLQLIMDALKTKSNLNTTSAGLTLQHDFTADTNTFVCCLCGHGHDDESHVDSDGVLTIMTNCDADAVSSIAGYDRTVGTVNEQCFDIATIDTEHKKIYLTRIGAGSDREFSY